MCRLTTGIRSEKCVVRRFRHCVNVIECTYTNLDSTVEPTAHKQAIRYSLLLLGYKPLQHVTVLNTVGNCNTVGSIVILYYTYIYIYIYIQDVPGGMCQTSGGCSLC